MSYYVVTKDGQQASGPFVTREAAEVAKANLEIESSNYQFHVVEDSGPEREK